MLRRTWLAGLIYLSLVPWLAGCANPFAAAAAEETPAATPITQLTTTEIAGKLFVQLPAEPPLAVHWSEFGTTFDSYFGIKALSNGKKRGAAAKYQCTELIHRYVSQIYGFPSRIGLGMGNGIALAEGVANYFHGSSRSVSALNGAKVQLEFFESGRSLYPPVVGSIISMHFTLSENGPGHVGILRTLDQVEPGTLSGALFAQHGALPLKIGAEVPVDTVSFTRDEKGIWSGAVHSGFFNRDFRIVGWTSAVVVN